MTAEEAIGRVLTEYDRATKLHGPFANSHTGYAVILEELDELWAEIKKRRHERSVEELSKEATQVGAMVIRFMVDLL